MLALTMVGRKQANNSTVVSLLYYKNNNNNSNNCCHFVSHKVWQLWGCITVSCKNASHTDCL